MLLDVSMVCVRGDSASNVSPAEMRKRATPDLVCGEMKRKGDNTTPKYLGALVPLLKELLHPLQERFANPVRDRQARLDLVLSRSFYRK